MTWIQVFYLFVIGRHWPSPFSTAQGGGGGATPPDPSHVSKLRLVELSKTDQQIALDAYSRLMVRFLAQVDI